MSKKKIIGMSAGLLLIVILFSLPVMCFAREIEWTTKANMPTARSWFSTSAVNGKIYAIGGWPGPFSELEEYDPATNTWTKKADMLKARAYLTSCVVDGKIYAIGGAVLQQYDPVTDQWEQKAGLPNGRSFLGAGVVNGKIYAIGGSSGEGTVAIVEQYDPATDSWSRKADMPTARISLSTAVVNDKIYAIGGYYWDNVNSIGTNYAVVEEYDPATDTWTTKAPLPTPTYDPATVVVDGRIYVIGGVGAVIDEPWTDRYFLSNIMKYDPATDTWSKEGDLPVPRTAMSASVVAGRIYVIGGHEVKVEPVAKVEVFQPVPWSLAHAPNPSHSSLQPNTWVNLNWSPGDFAASHDVYLGDSYDAVNDGLADTFRGNQTSMLFSAGYPGSPYPDGLEPGTTYYWRIDEVNDAEPDSPWKGPVWNFTVQPKTAYDPSPADGAEFIKTNVVLNWTAGLDSVLYIVFFGDNFDDISNAAYNSEQGSSAYVQDETTYKPGPLEFGKTYYWRVDELTSARGGKTIKGKVWSFTTKGAVENPNPSHDAHGVGMNPILKWTPADNIASHQIYFGTDKEAVRDADTGSPEYKGTQMSDDESFAPGVLSWNTTYYWRVDELSSDNPDSPLPGSLWCFTTGDFIIIDDFESYNADNQIWWSWKDGAGYSNHPTGQAYPGNGTGSKIGDDSTASTAGESRIHQGLQSMPFYYDNNKAGSSLYSQATLTLTYPRDWTDNGVRTLSIWYAADWDWRTDLPTSDAEPMYVVLNDEAVVYHDNPDVATMFGWTEWRIDLQEFADLGIDLTNVQTIGLGFGDRDNFEPGGQGLMSFDDIRLYR